MRDATITRRRATACDASERGTDDLAWPVPVSERASEWAGASVHPRVTASHSQRCSPPRKFTIYGNYNPGFPEGTHKDPQRKSKMKRNNYVRSCYGYTARQINQLSGGQCSLFLNYSVWSSPWLCFPSALVLEKAYMLMPHAQRLTRCSPLVSVALENLVDRSRPD